MKIWWIALVIKLTLSAIFPLSQDEAYYWVWSKYLQLSYFDHPGMVAWLFWLGHFLESFGQAVRWPSVILGHLTLLVWIFILDEIIPKDKLKEKSRFWLWLALSSPMLGFGSLLSTPDVPVVFFWSLSAWLIGKILSEQKIRDYIFLGIALGLGFCSKYHIVLFVFSLLIWLIFERRWKALSTKGIFLTTFFGFLFSLPVLIWNFQNGFQSFRFQLDHGLGSNQWEPFWTYSYLLAQLLLLAPVTIWSAFRAQLPSKFSFLRYLAWVPFVFFLFSSLKGVVEVNWPIVAFPAMYALAVLGASPLRQLWWSILPWAAIALFVTAQTLYPFTDNLPERIQETHYFDPILLLPKTYSPMYYGSYQMASRVWWAQKTPTKKLFQCNRHDFFDEIQGVPAEEKHFYVAKETWVDWPKWLMNSQYQLSKIQDVPPKFELYEVTKK